MPKQIDNKLFVLLLVAMEIVTVIDGRSIVHTFLTPNASKLVRERQAACPAIATLHGSRFLWMDEMVTGWKEPSSLGPSSRLSPSRTVPRRRVPLTTVPTPAMLYTSSIYKQHHQECISTT